MKKFHLTEDEKNNLLGRNKFKEYILDVVTRDIGMYVYSNILTRLKLPPTTKFSVSEDGVWLEVEDGEDKKSG